MMRKNFWDIVLVIEEEAEGITEERDKEGTYLGSLLDENDINNNNINKANYYIIQAFYGNYPNVVKELEKIYMF
ncbi:hypothetical protein OFR37_08660 [Brachyspira hyodysenteriae]|uniref:hypothetical protein n=1 Tax=Brachyspira hyodysenteriae TaxID=159 RepID=UPI0022CD5937|nr:hypothetical protein [Brachyspira hyodysenteriae]MDA0054968.1 hypothetical protein [Brachyspira hyodysenteriae]